MFSNGVFILSLLLGLGFPVHSQDVKPEAAEVTDPSTVEDLFFLCRRAKSVRWLRAYKLDTGKCRALYSKEGYLQVISSATFFSSCEGVLLSVKKNLEEGGFKCTQTPQASVIELETE